jgi:hypothetical protein
MVAVFAAVVNTRRPKVIEFLAENSFNFGQDDLGTMKHLSLSGVKRPQLDFNLRSASSK